MNMQRAAKRSRLRKGDGSPIRYMGSSRDSSVLEDTDSGNDEGPEEVYLSCEQYTSEFARGRFDR
jgi:hypothetical protein